MFLFLSSVDLRRITEDGGKGTKGGKGGEEGKEHWRLSEKDPVCCMLYTLDYVFMALVVSQIPASTATFNHVGDGLVLTHQSEASIRILQYPSLALVHSTPAHVGGCVAAALDPRGR